MRKPIEERALGQMRERGGSWAVYENVDLSHRDVGALQYIKYGEGCTYPTPPPHAPDTQTFGFGWRFRLVGYVDLVSGNVLEKAPEPVG